MAKVEWYDHHSSQGWHDTEGIDKVHQGLLVTDVGFVVRRDKLGITLVGGVAEDGMMHRRMFIGAPMIKKVITIK